MALQILSEPSDSEAVVGNLREAIAAALPGAGVAVRATGVGHFEIRVTSDAFRDRSRVAQQQLVYGAIAHLMKGSSAPVHAIDKLETLTPETR